MDINNKVLAEYRVRLTEMGTTKDNAVMLGKMLGEMLKELIHIRFELEKIRDLGGG